MEYRLLGTTGLKVGVVGVGCMTFGWRADAKEAYEIVTEALDAGINLFDTSVSYGRGVSESILGEALKRSGRRNDALIATKFGLAATPDAKLNDLGNSRRNLIAQCELSLTRLQTDWIDLLQIHNFSADVPLEETLSGLDQLVRDGKVRYIGCCNFLGWQLMEALWSVDRRNFSPIASHQARLNLLDRRAEADVMNVAHRHGVGNLTYSPLSEGLLTGKYRMGEAFPADSRFAAASPANNYGARLTAEVAQAIKSLDQTAISRSMSLWQLALAWVLANPMVSCALVGPSTREQVRALRDISDVSLGGELTEFANKINPRGACVFQSRPALIQ
jgi:aryl-alcohol dehydrogenase-like predicted oxidoreductase